MSQYFEIETYDVFSQKLSQTGQYTGRELEGMKDFYTEHYEEMDLREDVMNALENSSGKGLRDTQLMALLSAPENESCGGEKIEEDCKVGEISHSA
ncbi:MAG: hypothetical protein H8Z69_02150 [Nanohaloarchaea archaeon]|nr:hypothetical protein [Candidatus Nanohaloarchaea archaeon]